MAEEQLRTGPPDFIGVGTQRSGTTWWQRLLRDHPDVRLPLNRKKEQHYFDQFGKRPLEPSDIRGYHELFPRAPGEMSGEWTPRYMRDIWGPRVVAQAAPDAKLLIMFRDPVERYRSGVLHSSGRKPGRDTTALSTDAVERGRYALQLKRVYDYFDRSQVLVMQYERCTQDALAQYRRTLEFIGLTPDHIPEDIERTRGTATKSRREPIWEDLRYALVRELEDDVAELGEIFPELDLSLWRNFAHLAAGHEAKSRSREVRPRITTPRVDKNDAGPPDFVGVGTTDAGCAWWHRLLLEHPQVKRPAGGRSLEFFGTFCTREMTDEDIDAYHASFPRGPKKIVGEWTPDYMYEAWTPMLLKRAAPEAKLLVMLVNPVDRYAINLAGARARRRREETGFLSNAVSRGRYAQQLRGLLEYYEPSQILVLQFERCVADPAGQYARTLRFLGAAEDFRPAGLGAGSAPTPARAELWPDLEVPMLKELENDVLELRELVPDLDLSLWPQFAHLANQAPSGT